MKETKQKEKKSRRYINSIFNTKFSVELLRICFQMCIRDSDVLKEVTFLFLT
jgi:hypothetical protein